MYIIVYICILDQVMVQGNVSSLHPRMRPILLEQHQGICLCFATQ